MTLSFHQAAGLLRRCFVAALLLAMAGVSVARAAEDDEPKLPDPEDMTLDTKDNVAIKATYWEPKEPDKSTVPVILLHGWGGNRKEYDALGRILQEQFNHAVISIDLRGHGGSTTVRVLGAVKDEEIKPDLMSKNDFLAMVYDVQAAKNFLLKEHKKGKLNIEKLTLVGADMGAIVALNYAVYDWTRPRVAARLYKQGQDVRAMVLLSPPRSFKGMTSQLALSNSVVRGNVSTMIIVGATDKEAARDANALNTSLAKFHVKIPEDAKEADKIDKKDLFLMESPTALQGTKLLAGPLKTDQMISQFIELRLVKKDDEIPWNDRE